MDASLTAAASTNSETSGNGTATTAPPTSETPPDAAVDSTPPASEVSPTPSDLNEHNTVVEVQKLEGVIAGLKSQLEDVNDTSTDPTNIVIKKLKANIQIIIDKMNEICKVNTVMLEKIRQLTTDSDDLYDNQYNLSYRTQSVWSSGEC